MNRPQPGPPIDEAAGWLATLSDPNCTAEERRAFAFWLKRSNVNVEEFLTISTLTRRLETSLAWPQIDLDQLLAEAKRDEKGIAFFPFTPRGGAGVRQSFKWTLAAAVAVALLTSFSILDAIDWFSGSTYTSGLGELRSVTLEDGSIVQLDAQSRIRERFTQAERAVELVRGAAIFKVAKNPERPFRVSTGFADIVALGTAFNVSTRPERTVVTVLEGKVNVSVPVSGFSGLSDDRSTPVPISPRTPTLAPLELTAGQQAIAEPRKPLKRTTNVDPLKITAWTARRLYFEDTPLAEAVQEFARYSVQTIRIEDAGLAQKRITATFDAADPAALVTFLNRYTDATIDKTDEGWIVRQKDRIGSAQTDLDQKSRGRFPRTPLYRR